MQNDSVYAYVSTRADYDPAKTIFLFAPSKVAASRELAERFAAESGWRNAAEDDGAVLIVPLAPAGGWAAVETDLPGRLYDALRNSFSSRNGRSLFGREGKLWCWEALVYLAGYGDGADFAGDCLIAHPNRFAAVALAGGGPRDFTAGRRPSDHFMVKHPSPGRCLRNDQVPACLWLLGTEEERARRTLAYFTAVDGLPAEPEPASVGEVPALRWQNAGEPARQVLVSQAVPSGPELARTVLKEFFSRAIRWKDGPDGTLRLHPTREEFYRGDRFIQESVCINALDYPISVHLPEGMGREEAKGLPLVFSIHGRGEPAWLFAVKNGWDALADETRAFVLAVPDSPGNIWKLERDGAAFPAMIDRLCGAYGLDRSRVYLTGFSNGGIITREVGTAWPQLFAGISPSNAPEGVSLAQPEAIAPAFAASGVELPCWLYVGDSDPAAGTDVDGQLEVLLRANGCPMRPAQGLASRFAPDEVWTGENHYTPERGFRQGERFQTLVYRGHDGVPKVGYTVMKDMPHGFIWDQSRAAWNFLRHFSRAADGTLRYAPCPRPAPSHNK